MPQVPGCLTYAQLEPLRHCVDYLALGHLHKQFARDGWAHNPGSLEVCGMNERNWDKGLYDVTVGDTGTITARHVKLPYRPFHSETFPVDTYASPSELLRTLGDALQGWKRNWRIDGQKPVVEIRLTGVLQFEYSDLDRETMKALIKAKVGSLHEEIDTTKLKLRGLDLAEAEIASPEDLERSVLRAFAESHSRYAPCADAWASVMLEVKKLALTDTSPEAILATLQTRIDGFDAEAADGNH
jgi:DNA repair exonuclease SbcCD nuclease subunit